MLLLRESIDMLGMSGEPGRLASGLAKRPGAVGDLLSISSAPARPDERVEAMSVEFIAWRDPSLEAAPRHFSRGVDR